MYSSNTMAQSYLYIRKLEVLTDKIPQALQYFDAGRICLF